MSITPVKRRPRFTLIQIFKKNVLSSRDVVDKAIYEILGDKRKDIQYIKNNFSHLITEIQDHAYTIYLKSEHESWEKSIREYLENKMSENITRAEVAIFMTEAFNDLNSFFLSLTQSRRVRAGSAFQITIKELFRTLNYPFDEGKEIDGKPDFLIPSVEYFEENPIDCLILTVKRTLRERWRQIVTEGTRGLGFYLATIDDSITESQLGEISVNRIHLVVPDTLKRDVEAYQKAKNVISFENFFEYHLDPAIRRWKGSRII